MTQDQVEARIDDGEGSQVMIMPFVRATCKVLVGVSPEKREKIKRILIRAIDVYGEAFTSFLGVRLEKEESSTGDVEPMTAILRGLLVGMYFRRPAAQILAQLPAGTELALVPDPEGERSGFGHNDPDAMMVFTDLADMSEEAWEAIEPDLPGAGTSREILEQDPVFQLGYLAKAGNKNLGALHPNSAFRGRTRARLAFGPAGEPWVEMEE